MCRSLGPNGLERPASLSIPSTRPCQARLVTHLFTDVADVLARRAEELRPGLVT